jgi:hypothetical protein
MPDKIAGGNGVRQGRAQHVPDGIPGKLAREILSPFQDATVIGGTMPRGGEDRHDEQAARR